jgi:hypothetical protein
VLKLNAFGGPTGRRLPKDAYDVMISVTQFVEGPRAAIEGFRAEAKTGNTGYTSAVLALERDFLEAGNDGRIRAAEFHTGADRTRMRE